MNPGRFTLWLYGDGDSFYPLDQSRASFELFRKEGGKGRMVTYSLPGGQDGHGVHNHPAVWQSDLDKYLREIAASQ